MSEHQTTALRWIEHNPMFHSLMLGRIEISQISQGTASKDWFYSLRFTAPDEKVCFSCPTLMEAKAVCENHARQVVEDRTNVRA